MRPASGSLTRARSCIGNIRKGSARSVHLGPQTVKTRTLKNTLNPEWDETFSLSYGGEPDVALELSAA